MSQWSVGRLVGGFSKTPNRRSRSFKTFLKENYAIALDGCFLSTKQC